MIEKTTDSVGEEVPKAAKKWTPGSVPYGVSKFDVLRKAGRYYVDKTAYIAKLEERADFLFYVRPRRFGKSLFIDMLRCYYDQNKKDEFQLLFGDLAIGREPTEGANRFQVLALDFSQVGLESGEGWQGKFDTYMDGRLRGFLDSYSDFYKEADFSGLDAGTLFSNIVEFGKKRGAQYYLIIDEYDNFTNDLVAGDGKTEYLEITHKTGFYRNWFKAFKGTMNRIFMTGVSPVTMDDLTSGFNIATNISQEAGFNSMIGFSEAECTRLYADFNGVGEFKVEDPAAVVKSIKPLYDGYCFAEKRVGLESVFNADMALYYLNTWIATGEPPKNIVDANIKSDWAKLQMILDAQREKETEEDMLPMTKELAENESVTFPLVESFSIDHLLDNENFKSLYYYYGIVTMSHFDYEGLHFAVPNECVRRQIFDYMRKAYDKDPARVRRDEFDRLFARFAHFAEFKPMFAYLAEKFKKNSVIRDGLNGELLINGFMRAYLTMCDGYMFCPELELNGRNCDYAFFPNRSLMPQIQPRHSFVIELKHVKKTASEAEIAAKHEEALRQLEAYSVHPNLLPLADGTPVHFLDIEFVGREMIVCEEVKF